MRNAPRSARGGLLPGAGLGVAITIAVASSGSLMERGPSSVEEYRPDPAIPRWAGETVDIDGVGIVTDFDMSGTRLYLLDGSNHNIRVLERADDGWTALREFGRRGTGPGEFMSAHGIAVTVDGRRVVVSDDARLHLFTGDGEYLHSHVVATECRLLRPRVAAGARGLFVSGNCYRTGPVTDTMVSALYWTADGESYVSVASDVRFTRDGRTGSFMTALSPFTESGSRHAFGTGSTDCVHEIIESADAPPAAVRRCGLAARRYSSPAPAAFAASLRAEGARRGSEALFAWPDPLPAYMDRLVVDDTVVLLRPFTGDSLVLEAAGTPAGLLVTGMDGLTACRRSGCLWRESTVAGTRLRLLTIAEIRSMLATTHPEGR